MGLTTDPSDPRLDRRHEDGPVPQNDVYLVLSEEERKKGFLRPVHRSYRHLVCGSITTMGRELAETYAREPHFYSHTSCVSCSRHLPVGENGEFVWAYAPGVKVGT